MADCNNRDFSSLDFDGIKEDLIASLRSRTEFRDWDFSGSNLNLLMDILASNTFQNGVYNNMMFAELFLDSASQRANAMSHAKDLNYVPRSITSSKGVIDLRINAIDNPPSINVKKGQKFAASCGDKSFIFITDKSYNVKASEDGYVIRGLPVYEGTEVRQSYVVTGEPTQRFTIPDENVDTSSVVVTVRDNANASSASTEYEFKRGIYAVGSDENVFYIDADYENFYKVDFGRGIFGNQPVEGNIVEISYRSTAGPRANGSNGFRTIGRINGYPSQVISPISVTAGFGRDRESIQDIKYFAPKSLQTQERAVTKRDYEVLLLQRFPQIQAVSVYGGDEVDPPQFGKVIISVDLYGAFGAGDREIETFKKFINEKSPVTIDPVFVPAEFLYADLDILVKYNPRLTSKSEFAIEDNVKNTILKYGETKLSKFAASLFQSRLANIIDTSDESIISSDIVAKSIIEYKPELNVITNPSFNFNGELIRPYDFVEGKGFEDYKPAFTTTPITYNNTLVRLQDDGNGKVFAVTSGETNRRVFKRNLGSVNYATGVVTLSNFLVQGYQGSAIKFIANTVEKDIVAPNNRILAVRPEDIRITVRAV